MTVPLSVNNLRGREVGSYQFDVEYDPAVITPAEISADLAGTMSDGMSVVSNSPSPGLLKVVVYGAIPATNDGVFVNLRLAAIGEVGAETRLLVKGFRLNDAAADVITSDGVLNVTSSNTASLRGILLTAFGKPVAGAGVTQTITIGERSAATSRSNGSFKFWNMVVGETYTVIVHSQNLVFTPHVVSIFQSVTELDLIAEQRAVNIYDPDV